MWQCWRWSSVCSANHNKCQRICCYWCVSPRSEFTPYLYCVCLMTALSCCCSSVRIFSSTIDGCSDVLPSGLLLIIVEWSIDCWDCTVCFQLYCFREDEHSALRSRIALSAASSRLSHDVLWPFDLCFAAGIVNFGGTGCEIFDVCVPQFLLFHFQPIHFRFAFPSRSILETQDRNCFRLSPVYFASRITSK